MEENETIVKNEEVIKFIKGMTGKYSYEIRLTGKVENNLDRIKNLKEQLDVISSSQSD